MHRYAGMTSNRIDYNARHRYFDPNSRCAYGTTRDAVGHVYKAPTNDTVRCGGSTAQRRICITGLRAIYRRLGRRKDA